MTTENDFPKHDPRAYIVEEHTDTISRNYFVFAYLIARKGSNVSIRDCW